MSALVLVVERPGPYRDALLQALAARGARTDARDDAMEALASCEIAFPLVHGTYVEDGTLQGFLEIAGIP